MGFLVACAVSALDPIVLGMGLFTGYLAHRAMWQAVWVLAAFAVLGLILMQAYGADGRATYYALAQITALALIASAAFAIFNKALRHPV
jgi:hypothetical protein